MQVGISSELTLKYGWLILLNRCQDWCNQIVSKYSWYYLFLEERTGRPRKKHFEGLQILEVKDGLIIGTDICIDPTGGKNSSEFLRNGNPVMPINLHFSCRGCQSR